MKMRAWLGNLDSLWTALEGRIRQRMRLLDDARLRELYVDGLSPEPGWDAPDHGIAGRIWMSATRTFDFVLVMSEPVRDALRRGDDPEHILPRADEDGWLEIDPDGESVTLRIGSQAWRDDEKLRAGVAQRVAEAEHFADPATRDALLAALASELHERPPTPLTLELARSVSRRRESWHPSRGDT